MDPRLGKIRLGVRHRSPTTPVDHGSTPELVEIAVLSARKIALCLLEVILQVFPGVKPFPTPDILRFPGTSEALFFSSLPEI